MLPLTVNKCDATLNGNKTLIHLVFKPGAGLLKPGFLKLLWFARWYVCVSLPEGINYQWHVMV